MIIEDILRISDEKGELDIVFNPSTFEAKIGNIKLSKEDMVKVTDFLDNAIRAKSLKESKENSVISKLFRKKNRENTILDGDVAINWV